MMDQTLKYVCKQATTGSSSCPNYNEQTYRFADSLSIMFFCTISGEPPQDPVVSFKSGHVYERRLILKYITDNGTDPITGEKLDESDLVTIKASESNFYVE